MEVTHFKESSIAVANRNFDYKEISYYLFNSDYEEVRYNIEANCFGFFLTNGMLRTIIFDDFNKTIDRIQEIRDNAAIVAKIMDDSSPLTEEEFIKILQKYHELEAEE